MTQDKDLQEKANLLRKLILTSTTQAGSGHPTSSLSSVDLATVLFDKYFHYDLSNPLNPDNDRFILSKGHASPLFYALYAVAGAHPFSELLTLRKFGSRLEGHPSMYYPFTDAATGSLGQGLSIGAGISYSGKQEKRKQNNYVFLGDGELAEGQVWEACNFASHYKLDNLIAVADINRLGQSQETMFGSDTKEYTDRFRAFGFEALEIDGHDLEEIENAFSKTREKAGKPFAIVAKTKKGKGVSFLEDKDGWHGKALSAEDLAKALEELGEVNETLRFSLQIPSQSNLESFSPGKTSLPTFVKGQEVATREVYGKVLAEIAKEDNGIYALDGDVKNSTFSLDFREAFPERFIECFIAEQNMVGVAVGLQRLGKTPFVSTFAAFLTRAFDQIRMAGISKANIKFVGSHAGVSIGEDGPSQMGLEDIAMFVTIPDSVVVHPSDAVSATKLLPVLTRHRGISYLRTLRSKTPVLYSDDDEFTIGGAKVLRKSSEDMLILAACGITVHEALKAYEVLRKDGIHVRVIDCYSIKPIDRETMLDSLRDARERLIVSVEDHFENGGLGDALLSSLALDNVKIEKIAVTRIERSGKPQELLEDAGIDSESIVKKVKSLL